MLPMEPPRTRRPRRQGASLALLASCSQTQMGTSSMQEVSLARKSPQPEGGCTTIIEPVAVPRAPPWHSPPTASTRQTQEQVNMQLAIAEKGARPAYEGS